MLAATLLFLIFEGQQEAEKERVPASDWFVVHDLYVPDHAKNQNPFMQYNREILEDHRGFWIVEVQKQVDRGSGVFQNQCSGSGVDNYDTRDALPGGAVKLDWFLGRDCDLPEGHYRLELTKTMVKPGWPAKSIKPAYSNVFEVYSKGQ